MTEEQRKRIESVIKTHDDSYRMAESTVLDFFKGEETRTVDSIVAQLSTLSGGSYFEQKILYTIAKLLLEGKLMIKEGGNGNEFGSYVIGNAK